MPPIDTATQLCAVIGNPVGHSLSPAIHNAAFDVEELNFVYLAFAVSDLGAFLAGMRAMEGFRGLSVTIPHKQAVIEHLDEIDPLAAKVGSVNTITRERGRLIGSTTDGLGTLRAFADAGVVLAGKRILFLGAGGAVRAVAFAMADEARAASITLLGRSRAKVQALADDLAVKTPARVATGTVGEDIRAAMATHDVIVQGTPLGMAPEFIGQTCVPAESLRPDHVVFDMVYRPGRTRLVEDAEAAGCTVVPGIEMLIQQAGLQFETWTGRQAPIAAMRAAAWAKLGEGVTTRQTREVER